MSFYILTFKKKILLSFLLIAVFLTAINILLSLIADIKTTKTSYVDNKFSKIKHFYLNNDKQKDFVFIGSSRTFYHVSTNVFKNNNISIYNLGVSGIQFEDYPTLINKILPLKPKNVVISLSVNRLFDNLGISKYPTLKELSLYYKIDKFLFIKAFKNYVITFHKFLQYSEPIYYKIQSTYKKLSYNNLKVNQAAIQNNSNSYLDLSDCNVFDIKQTKPNQTSLKCTNGDGILTGNFLDNLEKNSLINLSEINKKSLLYLNHMIDELKSNNINVIIILEPIFENNFAYDIEKINAKISKATIFDLTNHVISYENWSDIGHLNNYGRVLYSNHLVSILKN